MKSSEILNLQPVDHPLGAPSPSPSTNKMKTSPAVIMNAPSQSTFFSSTEFGTSLSMASKPPTKHITLTPASRYKADRQLALDESHDPMGSKDRNGKRTLSSPLTRLP